MEYPKHMQRDRTLPLAERQARRQMREEWVRAQVRAAKIEVVEIEREVVREVFVKDPEQEAQLSEMLAKLEASAAKAAQPGANVPKLHPDLIPEQEAGETDADTNSRLKAELVGLYGANAWQARGGPEMTDEQKERRDYLQTRVWGGL